MLILHLGGWLLLIGVQGLFAPLDAHVAAHFHSDGALVASGPILGGCCRAVLKLLMERGGMWGLYCGLMIVVPGLSVWLIARFWRIAQPGAALRWVALGSVVAVGLLTILDLTYLSNDMHLYRLQGAMLARVHENPYVTTPDECFPADQTQRVPWTESRSPYGPLALLLFASASAVSPELVTQYWILKLVMTLPWVVLLVHVGLSRRYTGGERTKWLVWLGLNPLLLFEVCQNGHIEGWSGLLLFWLAVCLTEISITRAILGGVLLGAVCALKLSMLVVAPIVLVWILLQPAEARRGGVGRLAAAGVCGVVAVVVLVGLYWPLWEGAATFDGLLYESQKVARSVFGALLNTFLLVPQIRILSLVGNVLAAVVGAVLCWRRRSLAEGVIVCLLLQAVLNRYSAACDTHTGFRECVVERDRRKMPRNVGSIVTRAISVANTRLYRAPRWLE